MWEALGCAPLVVVGPRRDAVCHRVNARAAAFALSNKIDREGISAQLDDGVFTLTPPKAKEAKPRKISIG